METYLKTGFAQISLAAQKHLSWPNFGGGGGVQPPSSPGPYAYVHGLASGRALRHNQISLLS